MSYSGPVTIAKGPWFQLDSFGNGAAYTLFNLKTGASVWLDGEDADRFRGEMKDLTDMRPDEDDDGILSWLWDQCGYGEAATVRVLTVRRIIREDTVILLRPGETEAQGKERAIACQGVLKWDAYDCEYTADEEISEPAAEYAYLTDHHVAAI